MHQKGLLFVISTCLHVLQDSAFSVWERHRAGRGHGSPVAISNTQDSKGRRLSWELEMQRQKGEILMIKGKHLPQTAQEGRNPSQADELLESLGVLVQELQESPGFCLTQVPGCSCTSPRAVPGLESLDPSRSRRKLLQHPHAPEQGSAPADLGTDDCSKAG